MTKILIIAEHDNQTLNPSTAKCASCAAAIGEEIDIIVLGHGIEGVANEAGAIQGVKTVHLTDSAQFEAPLAANWATEISEMANGYSHILGPSTTFGRDLMPRIAALLGVNQVSDIMEVIDSRNFKRPVFAGNAIVNVTAPEDITVVATVRIASWSSAETGGNAQVQSRDAVTTACDHTRFVSLDSASSDRPDLQAANIVVSGGRALGSEENFELIYKLADKMGAGVGASGPQRGTSEYGNCS